MAHSHQASLLESVLGTVHDSFGGMVVLARINEKPERSIHLHGCRIIDYLRLFSVSGFSEAEHSLIADRLGQDLRCVQTAQSDPNVAKHLSDVEKVLFVQSKMGETMERAKRAAREVPAG